MLEQAGRFGSNLPLIRIRPSSPLRDKFADLIDDRRWIVLLVLTGESKPFVEHDILLDLCLCFAFFWLGDRGDKVSTTAGVDGFLRRLALLVEFPMLLRAGVGGVKNRVIEEGIGHKVLPLCPVLVYLANQFDCGSRVNSIGLTRSLTELNQYELVGD